MSYTLSRLFADKPVVTENGLSLRRLVRYPSTEGLAYAMRSGYSAYECTGIGDATAKDIVIADALEGKLVIAIKEDAFRSSSITSAVIPDSVKIIDKNAFSGSANLTSVIFYGHSALTTLGEYAFAQCPSLKSVRLPDTLIDLSSAEFCFFNCTGLTTVTLGNSVSSLPWAMFRGCSSLTSITIPDSVTSIGHNAFDGCTSLTGITIPSGVTSIKYSAFQGCTSLTSLAVKTGNSVYHSAGNCLIETASKTLIIGCKTSTIPANGSVTSIGDYAFAYCTSLTSITIPNGVTSIGEYAFYQCDNLTSIIIPASVTSLGECAFSGCGGLTSIRFTGTVAQWRNISKGSAWYTSVPATSIICSDGSVPV